MPSSTAQLDSNVPKYEVKLLMDPKLILNLDHKLEIAVSETFDVTASATKMNVQFLDTNDKDIYHNGWSPRIRKLQGEADYEITYKRRYEIDNGKIEAALIIANTDGFDLTNATYKAQIDWGFKRQTLSIHRDESYTDNDSEINAHGLPSEEQSRNMLIEKAPHKFNDLLQNSLGPEKLKKLRIYGPIFAERYTGLWSGEEVDIEVWPIKGEDDTGIEYIVEASFKIRKHAKALEKREELKNLLITKGWFLAQDSLKTSLIMKRY